MVLERETNWHSADMSRISLKDITPLIGATVRNWHDDKAPRLGAALSYYVILSLAPAVVIVLAVSGWAFGATAAQGRLLWQIQDLVGSEGAKVIRTLIEGTHPQSTGLVATLLGLVTLFFGASAAVHELRDALNTIWRVRSDTTCSRTRGLFNLVKERLISFALVLGAGLFLLASLVVRACTSAVSRYLHPILAPSHAVIETVAWLVSFAIITVLFAFVFKVLPSVALKWSDVAVGAVLTSLLFTAGKAILGVYLAKAGFAGAYGAAGSLVILLVWVYYSAQVFFLGVEFSRAYACRFGSMFAAALEAGSYVSS
jgi:membrane protein